MAKNVLLVLALILVIGLGYWWISANQQENNTTVDTEQNNLGGETKAPADEKTGTETPTDNLVVTYGSNGFSPATITIKKGQKVTFKNESGKSMWVATDDHPGHNIYPEFDAKTGIANGGTYEFIFNNIGTWGYHDHLTASKTGVVIVE